MTLAELIREAAHRVGSNQALAEKLGIEPARLSQWKHGHRPCPLTAQAQIAELAGEDAKEWVWKAVCHQLGRATAAVLLTLAMSLAAIGVPGAGGGGKTAKRSAHNRDNVYCV